jgi:hypothetical protein
MDIPHCSEQYGQCVSVPAAATFLMVGAPGYREVQSG